MKTKVRNKLLYYVEVVSIISLVYDVLLGFDLQLEHGIQYLRELLLKDMMHGTFTYARQCPRELSKKKKKKFKGPMWINSDQLA